MAGRERQWRGAQREAADNGSRGQQPVELAGPELRSTPSIWATTVAQPTRGWSTQLPYPSPGGASASEEQEGGRLGVHPGFGGSEYYGAEIAAATEGYERVVMLGDSMGASGALMHAGKASAVVAFSPQVRQGDG